LIDIDKVIASAVKTGKVAFGTTSAVQSAKTGKAKVIVLAANCPKDIKDDIIHYSKLSRIPVISYKGASMDLAEVCNKPFIISALTVKEAGDSDILKAVEIPEIQEPTGES